VSPLYPVLIQSAIPATVYGRRRSRWCLRAALAGGCAGRGGDVLQRSIVAAAWTPLGSVPRPASPMTTSSCFVVSVSKTGTASLSPSLLTLLSPMLLRARGRDGPRLRRVRVARAVKRNLFVAQKDSTMAVIREIQAVGDRPSSLGNQELFNQVSNVRRRLAHASRGPRN